MASESERMAYYKEEYFYSNPAFCQQSEIYNYQNRISPQKSQNKIRHPPVGAQNSGRIDNNCEDINYNVHDKNYDNCGEQEFYEEILVDDTGLIKEKKVVVISQNSANQIHNQTNKNEYNNQNLPRTIRNENYNIMQFSPEKIHTQTLKSRYEYIPMTEASPRIMQNGAANPQKVHRYTVIDVDEPESDTNGRYALVPLEDINNESLNFYQTIPRKQAQSNQMLHRYEYIDDSIPVTDNPQIHKKQIDQKQIHPNDNFDYVQNMSRKEQVQQRFSPNKSNITQLQNERYEYIQQPHVDRSQKKGNPVATLKLHELLTTPKKNSIPSKRQTPQKLLSPQIPRRMIVPPCSPIPMDPFVTPPKITPHKSIPSHHNPKAQQKLNYSPASRQAIRNTAVVAPICSSPAQSVYSETTYPKRAESWMNLNSKKPPVQPTLAAAAIMMFLCGGVSSGLCFYMMSVLGKLYYLNFGIVAGFTCLVLGLIGFRTRNCHWLPNRNYISGYIVLSVFSLLTCTGLLILLSMQPKPGTPLADMTSGAVCGISVLSLVLALTGVVSSYCCKYPPPDNRVQHCAQGFIV